MLFFKLHKIMVSKVTFVGFRGAIAPIAPPWIRPWDQETSSDLVPTGSKTPFGELESTYSGSNQNVPSVPTSDPIQSQAQKRKLPKQ